MVTKIIVNLELGHVAKTLDVATLSGHTHEWIMFVKGADKMAIEHFVEKVVFWLHDSYDPPKVVVKYPPYQVKQSGYAGFNILIDIHFKNKSEPKSVRFDYDLFLHKENMPPVNHTRVEMLTFTNPAEDFKKRLIKAGGIVKTQEAQPKERKPHKDIRHSEEKQSRSSKEKYDSEKPRHKTHHSDAKISKSVSSNVEKRKGSVSDEIVQKRKHEEKTSLPTSRSSSDSKPKEKDKIIKSKTKSDPTSMSSLFSIDDSIHVKQIKKKEISSHDSRKDKEKRMEPKMKKEIKQEYSEKKIRKQSPVVQKVKSSKEIKVKRPRTASSSDDSDMLRKASAILSRPDSDSDTGSKKKKKKHSHPDKAKMKKLMKRSKNTPEKVVKQTTPNPIRASKETISAPEREKTPQKTEKPIAKPRKQHRKNSESSYVSEKKPKPQPVPEKIKPSGSSMKVASKQIQRSSTPTIKKEKHSAFRGSTPVHSAEAPPREKKSTPTPSPRLPTKVPEKRAPVQRIESSSESSSNSSSSDDEMDLSPIKEVAVPKHMEPLLSPMSTSSSDTPSPEIPSFNIHSEEQEEPLNSSHEEIPPPVEQHLEDSESDHEDAFPQETLTDNTDQMDTSLETSEAKIFEEPEYHKEPVEEKKPVSVGIGDTLNYYPHMDDELFDELRQLQILLSNVTDETCLRKISSIVRKSGNFTKEGDMMNFDFCSLDRKTIHKIEKQLKMQGDK